MFSDRIDSEDNSTSMNCLLMGDDMTKDNIGWQAMPTFAQIPTFYNPYARTLENIFFVVINKTLYAKTSYDGAIALYRYSSTENQWWEVCEKPESHTKELHLVYIDPFFYFVCTKGGHMQRYNINCTNRVLEDVPSMPKKLSKGVVSTLRGKILAYGICEQDRTCRIQVYDPEQNFWTEALSEEDPLTFHVAGFSRFSQVPLLPILMEHNGSCYRVMFKTVFNAQGRKVEYPIVHRLKMDKELTSVEVGEEEIQKMIPENTIGAFQIEDDVFVCGGQGSVMKTGLKTWEDMWEDKVDLGRWRNLRRCRQSFTQPSNSVLLKFDSRLVTGN